MTQGWILGFLLGFCSNFCFAPAWLKMAAYSVGEIGVWVCLCIGGYSRWRGHPALAAWHPAWIRYGCFFFGMIWGIGHTAFPPSASKAGHEVERVYASWLYPATLVQNADSIHLARIASLDLPSAESHWGQTPASSWWPVHMNATVYTQLFGISAMGERIRRHFAAWISHRLRPLPLSEQTWLQALFLGEMQSLSTEIKNQFKRLGIFHIVVISGFHISFLGITLQRLAAGFLRLTYGFLLISSPWYLWWMRWARWGALALVFSFSFCIGFTPPVQRAFLSYGYREWHHAENQPVPLNRFLLHVAALQIFFFPASFLTVSTLMSWVSYATVLVSCRELGLWKVIKSYLFLQAGPLIFSGIFFHSLCFLSFLANLLFVPMFSGVFLGAFGLLLLPASGDLYRISRVIQQVYLTGVAKFSTLLDRYPLLYVDMTPLSAGYKRSLFLLGICFLVALVFRIQRVSCQSK